MTGVKGRQGDGCDAFLLGGGSEWTLAVNNNITNAFRLFVSSCPTMSKKMEFKWSLWLLFVCLMVDGCSKAHLA